MISAARALAPRFNPRPLDPRLLELLQDYPPWLFNERLYQSIELMERYSIDLALHLLDTLKVTSRLTTWRSAPELCELLAFRSRFALALSWLLERLAESGSIEARNADGTRQYRSPLPPWAPDLAGLRATGLAIDPANAATLDLLDHAASIYPTVAQGKATGEQVLFGAEGIPLWLAYFHNDNPAYAVNNWVGAFAAAECVADKTRLRVLEIGAGAGSASRAIVRVLHERDLLSRIERYLITEPNAFFRRRAQRAISTRQRDLPLEFQPLDIDRSWQDQGVASGAFDLIFGVNVLHVAKDLLFSLRQARVALAEDGWLVVGECLRPFPRQPIYAELMFQILDGFIDVTTDAEIRPNAGFLTADQWRAALARAGFGGAKITPDIERIREINPHFFTGAVCARP